jgi:hypothetical protein
MTLGEVLETIHSFDEESIIFAGRNAGNWSPSSRAEVIPIPDDPEDDPQKARMEYFVEVYHALEVLEAWSLHRDGRKPTVNEMIEAIAYYQENDCYLLPDPK